MNQYAFPGDVSTGLTKREYFAGLALQAMIYKNGSGEGSIRKTNVFEAVKMADLLLEELEKGE